MYKTLPDPRKPFIYLQTLHTILSTLSQTIITLSRNMPRLTGNLSGALQSAGPNYTQDDFCNNCWKKIGIGEPKLFSSTTHGEKLRICRSCLESDLDITFPNPPNRIRQKLPVIMIRDDLEIRMCAYCRVGSGNCRIKLNNMEHRLCQECTFYVAEVAESQLDVCHSIHKHGTQLLIMD